MVEIANGSSSSRRPTAPEVNRLYEAVQEIAGKYDFETHCLEGASADTIAELGNAYAAYLEAINTRRIARGKPPYKSVDEIPRTGDPS